MSLTSKQWKAKLAKVKDWSAVSKAADQSSGGNVPDGRYHGKVVSAELAESKGSGREQINLFCEVVEEGDYQGQSIGIFMGLDEEKSLPWTVAALRRCGYKVPEPEDVVDAVDSLNSDLPEVAIRVKNGFGNLDGLWEAKGEDTFEGDSNEVEAAEEVAEEEVVEESVEEVPEEAEAQVEIGTKVSFDWKGESLEGEVKEIDEAEGKIKVKVGNKVYPVKAENATIISEEIPEENEEVVEEEPEEDPEPVVKKKSKPAPKKAPAKPVKKNVKRK